MDKADLSSPPKPPARFFISAPSLKKLASQQLALDVCRHTAREIDVCDDLYEWENFDDYVPFEPDIPAGIPAVTKMVTDALWDPVTYSVRTWFIYHKKNVFYDRDNVGLNEVFLKGIDEIVLKPYGTVNYLKTAQNLLRSNLLSDVERFRLACITCMPDDIRYIWPFVSDDPLVTNYDSKQHPIIRYWIRGMQRGDFPRLLGGDRDNNSLETFSNLIKCVEWTAIEYFWNFLSNDEQITLAGNLFDKLCNENEPTTLEQLLFKLTSKEFQSIIKKHDIIDDLLEFFFNDTTEFGVSFLQVWHYLAYFIQQSNFPFILGNFVKLAFRDGCKSENCQLLNEIWINTPAHLKRGFFRNSSSLHVIFGALNTNNLDYIKGWNFDMSFFITLLTEFSFQTRKAIWCRYWPDLIVGTAPSSLQQIMKLCFNNDDEITKFKELDMMYFSKIHKFARLLIRSGRMQELDDYLDFCSTNLYYTASVKRQILASTDVQTDFITNAYLVNFVRFDRFVDKAFLNNDEAREYKKKLMLSSAELQEVYENVDRKMLGVSWY